MKNALKACLLLALIAPPAYAQSGAAPAANGMNCPMMADAADMQKQMGAMMSDMRAMMEGTTDPSAKARMQRLHEHMSAMMASMQKMRGSMMHTPTAETANAARPPTTPSPDAEKEEHDSHHPGE